jgi:hypothetical protein
MPYQFDFEPTYRILRCSWEGSVTDVSLKEYYAAARRLARATNPAVGILDFTGVTVFDASSETVRELASFAPALPSEAIPAFIVAPASVVYGMSRMYQALGRKTRPLLQVVHNISQAYSSLGIKEAHFKPLEQLDPETAVSIVPSTPSAKKV